MPTPETFEILVKGDPVTGSIHRPEGLAADDACPSVLVCTGFPVEPPETGALLVGLVNALLEAGLVVVDFRPRLSAIADEAEYDAAGTVDDASAVFRWMALQTSIDTTRIGVLGYSTGAIVAAGLATRSNMLAGVCLLAPAVPSDVATLNGHAPEDDNGLVLAPAPAAFTESLQALTPVEDIVTHDRPTLILHGAADRTVPVKRSFEYLRGIQLATHQVQHLLVGRADHAFADEEARTACVQKMVGFFTTLPPVAAGHGKA